jgi:flagella basal body P-ring formation protein FlgA
MNPRQANHMPTAQRPQATGLSASGHQTLGRWLCAAVVNGVAALVLALMPLGVAFAQAATQVPESQQQLVLEVRLWLARHEGASPAQIRVQPLDSRLIVPACPGGWAFSLPYNNTQSVQARCVSSTPPVQYIVRTEVRDVPQVVVANRSLVAGTVLQAEDMVLRSSPPGSIVEVKQDPAQWVGRVVATNVSAGARITPEQLSDQVFIYRLKRAVNAGTLLSATVAQRESVAATAAPSGFWSAPWPAAATVGRNLPAGHVLRQDDWQPMVATVIANVDIPRGVSLRPEMLSVVQQPQAPASAAVVGTIDELMSSETVRPIAKGSALSRHDVRAAVLVRRGDQVLLSAGRGQGFLISERVSALEDGRLGSRIRFRNPRSGRIIEGVVIGANAAEAL